MLTDPIPAGTTLVSATASNDGTCQPGTPVVLLMATGPGRHVCEPSPWSLHCRRRPRRRANDHQCRVGPFRQLRQQPGDRLRHGDRPGHHVGRHLGRQVRLSRVRRSPAGRCGGRCWSAMPVRPTPRPSCWTTPHRSASRSPPPAPEPAPAPSPGAPCTVISEPCRPVGRWRSPSTARCRRASRHPPSPTPRRPARRRRIRTRPTTPAAPLSSTITSANLAVS